MKQINHGARPGGPTMAAVSVTRLTQHAPVFRLELLLFSCSPTPPETSPVGGKRKFSGCGPTALTALFDNLVGAGENRGRDIETERLPSL
jgi:hypothetical protein